MEEDSALYLKLIKIPVRCQILEPFQRRCGARFVLLNSYGPHQWTHGHSRVFPALNALFCQMVSFLDQNVNPQ